MEGGDEGTTPTAASPADLAARIDARLRAAGTPERAEQERRYLKSSADHYGVTVWQTRRIVGEELAPYLPSHRSPRAAAPSPARRPGQAPDALDLAEALWAAPSAGARAVFDRRRAAVEVLDLLSDRLGPADLSRIEALIRDSGTWALVDDLAADVTGRVALRLPSETVPVLDRWAGDPDFWVRRSALLALLPAIRADTDVPDLDPYGRLRTYADAMLAEREFFIRKAIGWVLREAGKRRPEWVAEYVATRQDRMAGLTRREAVKHLPPELVPPRPS